MNSRTDFVCNLVDKNLPTNVRPLYVMAVNAVEKSFTVKFSGADSGVYYLACEGQGVGRIGFNTIDLNVESVVTAISPLQGSYLGGSLLTIDGINFSDQATTDNPVKVGKYWCLVESTSRTQIKCRVSNTIENQASQAEVIVFLRTSEEAKL